MWLVKGVCKTVADQQGKVCVLAMSLFVPIAMPINRNDAICVFRHHITVRIHAKGTHQIPILLGTVDEFGLVHFISDVLHYFKRYLDSHPDVHLVIVCLLYTSDAADE